MAHNAQPGAAACPGTKKNAHWVAAFLGCAMLMAGPAHPGDEAAAQISAAFSMQERIFQTRGGQRPEGYVVDRTLLSYKHTLAAGFDDVLSGLQAQDRWLDVGAGRGQAILDYYGPRFDMMHVRAGTMQKKARAVAVSIEDRRAPAWDERAAGLEFGRIRYLAGRRLREYTKEELGTFGLVTDVMGALSYTPDLSRYLRTVLALLDLNGSFFTVLADVKTGDKSNLPYFSDTAFLTGLSNAGGAEMTMCEWLQSITCVSVTCEAKKDWQPPVEAYHMRKTCNRVSVPELTLVRFVAGTPPERRFVLAH